MSDPAVSRPARLEGQVTTPAQRSGDWSPGSGAGPVPGAVTGEAWLERSRRNGTRRNREIAAVDPAAFGRDGTPPARPAAIIGPFMLRNIFDHPGATGAVAIAVKTAIIYLALIIGLR